MFFVHGVETTLRYRSDGLGVDETLLQSMGLSCRSILPSAVHHKDWRDISVGMPNVPSYFVLRVAPRYRSTCA